MSSQTESSVASATSEPNNYELFLGGTVGNNRWREQKAIPALLVAGISDAVLFNPTAGEWTEEARIFEDRVKESAPLLLFCLSNPRMPFGTKKGETLPLNVERILSLQTFLYELERRGETVRKPTHLFYQVTDLEGHALKQVTKMLADLRKRFPTLHVAELGSDEARMLDEVHRHSIVSPVELTLNALRTASRQPLSAYSYFEANAALHDAPLRTVVIFDMESFDGDALAQNKSIYTALRDKFPGAPIFDNIGAGIRYLVERLPSAQ